MCRLLSFWVKQEKGRTSRHLMESWIVAWLKSTKDDHYLNQVYGVPKKSCVHKDGWGVVTIGTKENYEIEWEQTNLNLNAAFSYKATSLSRSFLLPPLLKLSNQILVAHARRASVNMPVDFQQVQPLVIHDNKNSKRIYIVHNGTVDSNIINGILKTEYQLNTIQLREFSDTQILTWYISQKLKEAREFANHNIKDFWIPVLQEVIDQHQKQDINYQMQLIILEIVENKPHLIVCSALSEKSRNFMPYYQLFLGKREDFRVVGSSTVIDHFESNHQTAKWSLDPIENKTITNLTPDGEYFYNF